MKTKLQALTPALAIAAGHVVTTLLTNPKVRSAEKYLQPDCVIKATCQFPADKRNSRETFILTIGAPNFAGREFVKLCKKAGEKFPLSKVQLKFWPKKKK